MTHWCASCHRYFDEAGFCPYDGKPLQPVITDGAETLPSMIMPAAGLPTEVPDAPSAGFRAVSASESTGSAIAAIQNRLSEYDRLVGQTLDGRYHIERKLGEGGMGVVFAARHAVIERPLAIKVLKREVMRDTATIKRFVQEAKAASRIGHPNIVDVTDFGTTTDGLTYQVMEFVDGLTLGIALRQGAPFSPGRSARIAVQLARALGAAHTKGIVHRDLKPENIFLVDRDGRKDFVKIVDFGIAKVIPVDGMPIDGPRLTRAGAVFGTPEYMAPEQAAGRGDTDGRVDVYALGIILYEMLTGRVPHRGDTMVRTLAMQMLDPIEPPSRIRPDLALRPELEAVVMKALAKKREHRYPTMAELASELERAAGVPPREPAGTDAGARALASLPPVPPGADPSSAASAMIRAAPRERSGGVVSQPADTRGSERRYRDEPAFVHGQGTPQVFDHAEPTAPVRTSRWPLALGAAMVIAAGGVAVALYVRRDQPAPVVATTPFDASRAPSAVDAPIVIAEVPVDAPLATSDAPVVAERKDARVRVTTAKVDGGIPAGVHLTPRGTVAIKVVTVPDGGRVFNGFNFAGTSTPTIESDYGTKAKIRCLLNGYEEGHVDVVFDGKTDVIPCTMKRIVRCVDGLKNPIDECPDARMED